MLCALGVEDERKAKKMFVISVLDSIRLAVCECGHRKRFLTPLIHLPAGDRELIEMCVKRSRPMGDDEWTRATAVKLDLESTLRATGRPKKSV